MKLFIRPLKTITLGTFIFLFALFPYGFTIVEDVSSRLSLSFEKQQVHAALSGLYKALNAETNATHTGDGTEVTAWGGSFGNNGTPRFRSNRADFNFHDIVEFNGSSSVTYSSNPLTPLNDDHYTIVVYGQSTGGAGFYFFGGSDFNNRTTSLAVGGAGNLYEAWGNNSHTNGPIPVGPGLVGTHYNGSKRSLYVNSSQTSTMNDSGHNTSNNLASVGAYINGSGGYFDGDIAEFRAYSPQLSLTERDSLFSYFAIKYGNDNDISYVAGDGATVVWDETGNAGYTTDVFGLGEDSGTPLDQRVAHSINDTAGVVLATTQDFLSANNDGGRTSVGDGNYLIMGNNAGVKTFTAAFDDVPNQGIGRVWKIDETGDTGATFVAAPSDITFLTNGLPAVVLSNDTTFDYTDTVTYLTLDAPSGRYFASIDPSDGQYMTFATAPLIVEFDSLTYTSADESTNITLNLTVYGRDITAVGAQSIDVDITGGTATGGSVDYTYADPTTVVIPAADYTIPQIITSTFVVDDDLLTEGPETALLALINPTADLVVGSLGIDTTTVTIADDDGLTVEFDSATYTSVDESTNVTLNLIVSGADTTAGAAESIDIDITGGTATGGSVDYTYADPTTIVIPTANYNTPQTITSTFVLDDDALVEGNETALLALINPTGIVSVGTQGTTTVTITDDEVLSVEFDSATYVSNNESTNVTLNLTVSGLDTTLVGAQSIDVDITGGTATGGSVDYTYADPTTVAIPAADYTVPQTITSTFTLNDDALTEGDETALLALINSSVNVVTGVQDTTTVTITDDEGLTVEFDSATYTSLNESTNVTLNLTVSGLDTTLVGAQSIDVDVTGGTATGGGVDYTYADPTTVAIPAADYTTPQIVTSTFVVDDDGLIEGNETALLALINPSANITVDTQATTTVTITDDEILTVEFDSASYNSDDESTNVTLNLIVSGADTTAGAAESIDIDITGGTATGGSVDYTYADPTTIVIPTANYNTPQTITSTFVLDDDALVEGNETALLALINPTGIVTLGAQTTFTVIITDDDVAGDTDGDGVPDATEDAGFNGGDGNGDGTLDSLQQFVSGALNPVTGAYTTLEATGTCTFITQNQFLAESSLAAADASADYPVGLVDFQVTCANPGDSSDIKLYYTQTYDTSNWVHKKYNTTGGLYTDISGLVTYGTSNVGGTNVTTASFTVTDGDATTDEDGVADTIINDPSGPSVSLTTSSSGGGGGSRKFICEDPDALNYNSSGKGSHKQSLCSYEDSALILSSIEGLTGLTCPVFTEYVRQGDRGNHVMAAQTFLQIKGFYSGLVDGVFGKSLFDAVVSFQNANWEQVLKPWGIAPGNGTGWLYQSTRAHMNRLSGCNVCVTLDNGQKVGCDEEEPVPETPVLEVLECPHFTQYYRSGDRGNEVGKIQTFLTQQGFNPGSIDSTMGPITISAIKRFQTAHADVILEPWGLTSATGRWYQTTRHTANKLAGCSVAPLTIDNGVVVD